KQAEESLKGKADGRSRGLGSEAERKRPSGSGEDETPESAAINQLLDSTKALERDSAGKQKLRDMLNGKQGDDAALAAQHILQLMHSHDPQQSRDGERMLKLVLDKE